MHRVQALAAVSQTKDALVIFAGLLATVGLFIFVVALVLGVEALLRERRYRRHRAARRGYVNHLGQTRIDD